MRLLIYATLSILILFLGYRTGLFKAFLFSILISICALIFGVKAYPFETFIFVIFINAVPVITETFKRDFSAHKERMRTSFEEAKTKYKALVRNDKQQVEANLKREKRLQQVLSLYEISKDMSSCLAFEDIFDIFFTTLKKSFRFKLSRLVLLKESGDVEASYHIALGQKVQKTPPDDFDMELVKLILETKKIILISPQESSQFLRRLAIIKNFEHLICIPLFVEEKIAGILYIEDMPRQHFENFLILTSQFAMQFQKVILYKKVQEMSITDSLTEISTRRYFLERFSEEIRRSMRHKSNLSFLMLDLDRFKESNDRFGHLVGDVILKEVSDILKSSLREIDIIGRYGGEEFAIVLAGIERKEAFHVAGRIRENIEGAIFKAYDEVVSITVSIGVSVFPNDGVDMHSLIESADKALYRAKETGRNRVC
ncbi:GGDEF domain-containing protein [Candidatus Omnitrophota bacterium]